jgi:hypothetical protein
MDKSIQQGAASTVWASVAPRIATDESMRGVYISDCAPVAPNSAGMDTDRSGRNSLWEATSRQISVALREKNMQIPTNSIFFSESR